MKAGGWRDYKSVLRYTHVTSEEIGESIERLPGGEKSGKMENIDRRYNGLYWI